MSLLLDDLVNIAGASLESEDRYLIGCSAMKNKKGGILRFPNERYYQFVACRGWLSRWDVAPERRSHDAVIEVDGKEVATVEMKCWLTSQGEVEIPKIRTDFEKLRRVDHAAFLLIFSANLDTQTSANLNFLQEKLPELKEVPKRIYTFPTISPFTPDVSVDFWAAAWQLRP